MQEGSDRWVKTPLKVFRVSLINLDDRIPLIYTCLPLYMQAVLSAWQGVSQAD
jgi:hypothetical protein